MSSMANGHGSHLNHLVSSDRITVSDKVCVLCTLVLTLDYIKLLYCNFIISHYVLRYQSIRHVAVVLFMQPASVVDIYMPFYLPSYKPNKLLIRSD